MFKSIFSLNEKINEYRYQNTKKEPQSGGYIPVPQTPETPDHTSGGQKYMSLGDTLVPSRTEMMARIVANGKFRRLYKFGPQRENPLI